MERLRQENREALSKLQPRGPGRKTKAEDKPKEDLRTTTQHGRRAALTSGSTAKEEAMKGFDTGGTEMASMPTHVVDLRVGVVSELHEVPKDIGADIPNNKLPKVGKALQQNPTWQELKSERQVIEQKQESIKAQRKALQDELATQPRVKRQEVLQKIAKTYAEEDRVRNELHKKMLEQKQVAEEVAKTVTIEIVDDDASDNSTGQQDQSK